MIRWAPGSRGEPAVDSCRRLPGPGVIVAGRRLNAKRSTLWPSAVFDISAEASCTAEIFCRMLWDAWLSRLPLADLEVEKVLILDTGGGSLLHLSLPIYKLLTRWRVRPCPDMFGRMVPFIEFTAKACSVYDYVYRARERVTAGGVAFLCMASPECVWRDTTSLPTTLRL